jgi:hypothetical protein
MHALPFVLDEDFSASSWGSNLRSLLLLLAMIIAGIGLLIWWLKRG